MNELSTIVINRHETANFKVNLTPDGLRQAAELLEKMKEMRCSSVYYSGTYETIEFYMVKTLAPVTIEVNSVTATETETV